MTAIDPSAARSPAAPGSVRFVSSRGPIERPLPIDDEQAAVFATWLRVVRRTGVRYALAGAYVVYAFTGSWRDTKDLDIFVEPENVKTLLDALKAAGFETEVRDRYWLAKAHSGPYLLDLLFAVRHTTSLRVSPRWFDTCRPAEFLGVPTSLLGPEEVIATKAYVAAHDRFDGADIVHLVRAAEGRIDWRRVIDLLGGDDEIVLWYLLLFRFVYPQLEGYLPTELMQRAFEHALDDRGRAFRHRGSRGMLLDPVSFAVDRDLWGDEDSRSRRPLVDGDGRAI